MLQTENPIKKIIPTEISIAFPSSLLFSPAAKARPIIPCMIKEIMKMTKPINSHARPSCCPLPAKNRGIDNSIANNAFNPRDIRQYLTVLFTKPKMVSFS